MSDKRIYGTKRWRTLRKAVFARDNYICQMCGKYCTGKGRADPLAPECDHIVPHKGDEALKWDMSNLQTLHKRCHSLKTAIEDGGMHSGAQSHPDWLPKPKCEVEIISGPPGGGKTTYALEQAGRNDTVIDLDDCFRIVCGVHGHDADRKHLGAALRVRNKMLSNLASKRQGKAFFIVGAPTKTERDWWADKLNGKVTLIRPDLDTILGRDIQGRRKERAREWFDKEHMNRWRKPTGTKIREVGLDGYPIG